MTPERWERIKSLFEEARQRPQAERDRFLTVACDGDDVLRREIEALLVQPLSSAGFAAFVGGQQPPAGRGAATLTGRRVGGYAIHELLGRGGMGEVYRAHDSRLARDVAIKVLPLVSSSEPDRLHRFEREARMLAALNHPHVGAIYGVEEVAGLEHGERVPALVLELVDGETLADRIRRGPIPLVESLTFARQMADGLDAAHRTGIVHRDLKPANIKITAAGVVKVLDFGLAKAAGVDRMPVNSLGVTATECDVRPDVTRAGAILGTMGYMSPEQTRGEAVDHRTDIWAFGCVLYEMLTGFPAYARSTNLDTVAAILEGEPDWSALPPSAPPTLRKLLRQCLDKDPRQRLHSIADARAVLDALLLPRGSYGLASAAAVGVVLAAAAVAFWWFERSTDPVIDPSRWVQITAFPDAVSQPALSPDGRLLAFIRGPNTFTTPGQVYVKQLPDGAAIPLTDDDLVKMGPAFSPDGARIAYTVNSREEPWATWMVPVLRGTPRRWLQNASGLTWTASDSLLFSEVRSVSTNHMGIVLSNESRTSTRAVYYPPHTSGMAHRSSLSPDRRWALVVEMDERGVWLPCRLVPADGSGRGTAVGPPRSRCTDVAWTPDGRFMYFTADIGNGFHLWRQRFPDGAAEQLTRGPTAEEGLAIAPDGRSLITSVGLRHRSIWIHDSSGDRQLSGEGYAYWPLFSRDGQTLVYRVAASVSSGQSPTELWKMDLRSGATERLLPTRQVIQYDLSADDRIVAVVPGEDGKSQVWVASLDGTQPPRQIPGIEGDSARFGNGNEIVYRGAGADGPYLFRVDVSGEGRRRVSDVERGQVFGNVSPDGQWISTVGRAEGNPTMAAFSTTGQLAPVPVLAGQGGAMTSRLRWSRDGRRMYLNIQFGDATAFASGRTYVIPLRPGSMLPDIPAGGFRSEEEIAAIPGVEVLPYGDVAPGPVAGTYAFSRETVTRNLYRIPLP